MSAERQRLLQAIERYEARTPELSKETKGALKGIAKELNAPERRDTPGTRAAAKAAPTPGKDSATAALAQAATVASGD